jgi:hypothetical protein
VVQTKLCSIQEAVAGAGIEKEHIGAAYDFMLGILVAL